MPAWALFFAHVSQQKKCARMYCLINDVVRVPRPFGVWAATCLHGGFYFPNCRQAGEPHQGSAEVCRLPWAKMHISYCLRRVGKPATCTFALAPLCRVLVPRRGGIAWRRLSRGVAVCSHLSPCSLFTKSKEKGCRGQALVQHTPPPHPYTYLGWGVLRRGGVRVDTACRAGYGCCAAGQEKQHVRYATCATSGDSHGRDR